MKFGIRKPSLKKSLKAKTIGKLKREVKRAINPAYGKKGIGRIKDPKRSMYNKIYNKTTYSILPKGASKKGVLSQQCKKQSLSSSNSSSHILQVSRNKSKLEKQIIKDTNTFYVTKEHKIIRRKWSYRWTATALIFFDLGIGTVLLLAFIIAVMINAHNKKPVDEVVERKKYLSSEEKESLLKRITMLSDSKDKLMSTINTTIRPEVYFSSLDEFKIIVFELLNLYQEYHLPFDLLLDANQNEQINNMDETAFNEFTIEATSNFIQRYYEDSKHKASDLKTERGFINRMNRRREELEQYTSNLALEQTDLINQLWS